MISFRDIVNAFTQVGLDPSQPVIVHASLSAVGDIRGGAETLLGALLSCSGGVLAPTFTYQTMVIPEIGPPDNAIDYGAGSKTNRMAEFFLPDKPADRAMGILPEIIRCHPNARRSSHPILSFAGIGVPGAIDAQTMHEPLAPIGALSRLNGNVLLIGVNHTANTSIHYAERLAGRKQFIRWALTPQGVRECPGFPGCSDGFEAIVPRIRRCVRVGRLGGAKLQAITLPELITTVIELIRKDPTALLCNQAGSHRCDAVRRSVIAQQVDGV